MPTAMHTDASLALFGRYDEPVGKNDGTVDGHTYFACPPNHGTLAKPKFVRKLTMLQLTAAGDLNDEYSDDENDPEC